ncbi:cation:proton antiporter [Prevotella sp. kh1p2]|uniref:cation:proton antiporter n=1 Tax=Prevotella sp. kh1p2 TaxID=1761883 RepID=UPI000B88FD46|nr:cation:proton antiporter [Prevotella sp. kh1p2]
MAELPDLIKDLALILVVAGAVTLLFKKFKQPLVLGYIVAGFLVSPHMPYTMSVVDKADIQTWADIGVMFLLFSLGLDFSFKKILKMGMAPVIATLTIIFSMMMTGILVGHAFGWSKMDCIFLGGMLAMSSTTIIYKAFDDMGLRQQRFAGLVMSVLILEDVLAIVMMVMLSAIAGGSNPDGGQMLGSVLKIGFFLVLWFVVGIFLVPWFLRATRKLMNDETMIIVALGLCCLMAVVSTAVGFSSAFGAFVMGSILAETIEADKIIKLVEPVKNLFGAVFFVSVGMLVDPKILTDYALPIVVIVLAILLGQGILGTTGFMLSGQSLKTAMRCGFSMAQIGEFAFIIASLGLSLHVIGEFLYPVVVAVSVITTFLTPYMIRFAEPCYNHIEKRLPRKWSRWLNHLGTAHQTSAEEDSDWKKLLKALGINVLIYSILSSAVIAVMFTFFLPFIRSLLPHWWANGVCGVLTVALIAPFLRSIVMKKNNSAEFKSLWTQSHLNRLPLAFTILVRVVIAIAFIFYICNYLTRFTHALMISIGVAAIVLMVLSRGLKHRSIRLERLFVQNLHSRDIQAQVMGRKRPLFESRLLDRDIHISDFDIPEDSTWGGKTLQELQFRNRFGIHVSSILRGNQRINIPNGAAMIFPGDKIQAIGNDEQLQAFGNALRHDTADADPEIEQREMKLSQLVLREGSPLIGLTLRESGIRNKFNCMVVGVDEGQENLTLIDPSRPFMQGDIIWVVGEQASLDALFNTQNKPTKS